jgi:CubicO group peptidase (beta-lactamase class C family)
MPFSIRADRRSVLFGLAAAACAPRVDARPVDWRQASALARSYVAAKKVSGMSLAIRHGDAPTRFLHFGAQAFDGPAVNERTIWRIFSMTKPITGVAALLLVEDGKLRLDQPVGEILPAFAKLDVLENGVRRPAKKPMLVSHLLTHTAGLGYHINTDNPLAWLYSEAGLKPGDPSPLSEGERPRPTSLVEFGARLAEMPLLAEPGATYAYSVSLDLAGLVIQTAAGMPFETFLQQRLFDRIGMPDTGFFVPAEKRARLSMNYSVSEAGVEPAEPADGSPYFDSPGVPSGGGGLVATAADYARFNQVLMDDGVIDGRRVMRAETARLAHSNLLPAGVEAWNGSAFGAGMGVTSAKSAEYGQEPVGSYGWAGAAGTLMWNDPVNRLSVAMMTQYVPSHAYPVWSELRTAVYRDLAAAR